MAASSIARVLLGALVLAGCAVDALDLAGKRCPCGSGFVCESATGLCAPAGRDAGAIDAQSADAPLDGAASDGGRVDAGPPATRCDDLLADAIFCDGFEDTDLAAGALGPWSFTLLVEGAGELETVSDPVRHGARAMRASTLAPGGRAAIGVRRPPPISGGTLWVRMWLFLPASETVESASLLYVGNQAGSQGIAMQSYDGGLAAAWIGPQDDWRGSMARLPRDRWTCLQYRVLVSDSGGEVELFVDDVSVVLRTGVDTLVQGGFATLEAGLEYTSDAQEPLTLFVDEVAVSRDEMPCE